MVFQMDQEPTSAKSSTSAQGPRSLNKRSFEQIGEEATINTLPLEVLQKILVNLSAPDRLRSGLTCRRWALAISESHMLRDVQLVAPYTLESGPVFETLVTTKRCYSTLIAKQLEGLKFAPDLWKKIGVHLRELKLLSTHLKLDVLYRIFWECPNLESLDFSGSSIVENFQMLPGPAEEEFLFGELRKCLQNVRSLCCPLPRFRSRRGRHHLLNQLLGLMPNVDSFTVKTRGSDFFTCESVVSYMSNLSQKFVKLDFSWSVITDEVVVRLVELYSTSLRELRLDQCMRLTQVAWTAVSRCAQLRCLSIRDAQSFQNNHLEKILLNAINLEFLSLNCCIGISNESIRHVDNLKRLRHLEMPECRFIDDRVFRSLSQLSALRHLHLGDLRYNVNLFRHLASLKDLRTLIMPRRTEGMTLECFAALCESFRKLELLELGFVAPLSDADELKFSPLRELKHLRLWSAPNFSHRVFREAFASPKLESLELREVSPTPVALFEAVTRHPNLKSFALLYCDSITDNDVESILRNQSNMRKIVFLGCSQLTDRTFEALHDLCPQITDLRVANCQTTHLGEREFLRRRWKPSLNYSFE